MMMLYFKQYLDNKNFNDILQFVVRKMETYCLYKDEIKSIGEHGEVLFSSQFNSKAIYSIGDEVIFSGKNFYLKEGKIKYIDVLSGKYFTGILHNDIMLFTGNEYTFYDIKNSKIIRTFKFNDTSSIYKLLKNSFICHGGKFITLNNFSTATELWRKEFTDNIHKLEVWNEQVVLVATHGNYITTLYALAAATGEVIWEKPNMATDFQIQSDFIYCFTKIAFSCINISDGEIVYQYNLKTKFIENDFDGVTNMTVFGEYVYFSGIHDTVISMWELTTGNLVWHYRLYPKENTGRGIDKMFIAAGEAPKVIGNRLYQLDGSKTLHIFERA